MTEPPDDRLQETQPTYPSGLSLRDELLRDLSGGECLPLAHVDSVAAYDHPDESLATRQSHVIDTIASLLTDGLLVVGDIVGGGDDYVEPWKLTTDDALRRLRELYVAQHENEPGWSWTTWFALTPEGERVAEETSTKGNTE